MRGVKGFISGTLVSRALGLVREAVIAYLLGAHDAADAFYVALRVPMILRDMVAENVVQTAFIPSFIEARDGHGSEGAFLSAVILVGGVGLAFLTLLGVAFAPALVKLTAWGFAGEKFVLTSGLTRLMFPFVILVSGSALASGLLNTKKRFFVPALSPAFFNLGIITMGAAAGWLWGQNMHQKALFLAGGVLAGGAAQFLFQLPFLRGFSLKRPDLRHPSLRSLRRLLGPVLVSTGFSRLTLVVNTLIASFLGTGAVAYLNYAFRLMQLPLGLFGVGVATVALPGMAEKAAKGASAKGDILSAEALSFFLTAPATVYLILVAQPLLALLFSRGSFGWTDSFLSAQALCFYALAVPGLSLSRVYLNSMFARKRTREPNISFGIAAAGNIGLSLALAPLMGFPGLALATGIAAWVQTLYLRHKTGMDDPGTQLVVVLLAALVSFAVPWFFLADKSPWLSVSAELLVGTGAYLALTWAMGIRLLAVLFKRK